MSFLFLQHRQSRDVYTYTVKNHTIDMNLHVTVHFEMIDGVLRHHYAVWHLEVQCFDLVNGQKDEAGYISLNGRLNATVNDTSMYVFLDRVKQDAAHAFAGWSGQTAHALHQLMQEAS